MGGTLEVLFRYRPGHRPDVNRLLASVQEVLAANGVEIACSAGLDTHLSSPLLESLSVNGCSLAAVGDHRRLFDTAANISSPDQVVVFVVRRIADGGPFSGCAVHPRGIPGLVLTEAAATGTSTGSGKWVLAHELGHVLGLAHVSPSNSLMCDPATAISASTPTLTLAERQSVMRSSVLGRSGRLRVAGRLSELPRRTMPERTIDDRELAILNPGRRTLLDHLI